MFTSGAETKTYHDFVQARMGTSIVGVVNWLACIVAIPLLKRFGRKTLMLSGHTGMTIALAILGVFAILENNTLIIIFTLVFIAFFEIGVGSLVFLYLAEVMTEIGISMALAVIWSLTILVSLVTPRMIEALGQQGLYFMFAGINVAGWLFILFLIRETKGRSKTELKTLYGPKEKFDYQQNQFQDDMDLNHS